MHKFKLRSIAAITALCGGSTLVAAQPSIEEVTVTARKRSESLQDAPISIAAFSADELAARGASDISDIGDYTPNLTFDSTSAIAATSSAASIYIRGIGQSDWALPTDPGVGLYLDGVYIARSVGGVLDALDLERVEVLRGPQGTLFGRNTIGGAISLVTRKPDFDQTYGDVSVTIGEYQQRNVRGTLNLPLAENLAMSVALSSKKRDGYVDNHSPGAPDLGDEDALAGRVALRWQPTADLSVDLSMDYTKEREAPAANVLIDVDEEDPNGFVALYNQILSGDAQCSDLSDPGRLSNPLCMNRQWVLGTMDTQSSHRSSNDFVNTAFGRPMAPASELNLKGYSLSLEWQLNDELTFKSISSYREIIDGYWARDADHSELVVLQTLNDYEQDQFTQEFQLLGDAFDGRLNWIVGSYWFEEQGCHLDVVEYIFGVFRSGGCIDNNSKALFGQASYELTPQVHITLGARWSDEEKRFHPQSWLAWDLATGTDPVPGFNAAFNDSNGNPLVPGGLVLPDEEARLENKEFTPYINVAWHFDENVMFYASYSEGFKGGAFTQRAFPPLPVIPVSDPEYVTAYEMGMKSNWLDNRLRFNMAFFFTDYEDLQINTSAQALGDATGIGVVTQNAAEATILGTEIEVKALISEALAVELGIGYMDAEYDSLADNVVNIDVGNGLVNTPEFTGTLGLTWTQPLGDLGEVEARLDYNYRSKVYNDTENTPALTQEGYGLVNLGVVYRTPDNRWSLSLHGRNLTDKEYLVTGFNDGVGIPGGAGLLEAVYGMPRVWSFTGKYSF